MILFFCYFCCVFDVKEGKMTEGNEGDTVTVPIVKRSALYHSEEKQSSPIPKNDVHGIASAAADERNEENYLNQGLFSDNVISSANSRVYSVLSMNMNGRQSTDECSSDAAKSGSSNSSTDEMNIFANK